MFDVLLDVFAIHYADPKITLSLDLQLLTESFKLFSFEMILTICS